MGRRQQPTDDPTPDAASDELETTEAPAAEPMPEEPPLEQRPAEAGRVVTRREGEALITERGR